MMKKFYYILTISALWIAISACSDHDGMEGLSDNQLTLSMDVVLAASNSGEQTRAVGDPGLAEFFEKPRHLYLFLAVGEPTTPNNNPVYCYALETSQSKWTRSADSLVFKGRELKTVNWDSNIQLNSDLKCRAYMVASYDELTFNPVINCNDVNRVTSGPTTESALLDLKFYAYAGQNDYSKLSLRDVYSTPYNLSNSWTKMSDASTNRTNYYGTVTDIKVTGGKGLISINDTLYHTAAKVDFQWNAQSHTQSNVMVNALVDNAPKQGYLFRPSETVSAGTYSKVLLNGGEIQGGGTTTTTKEVDRYIMVADSVKVAETWDNQFWIVAKEEFHSGDLFELSADIKADKATSTIETQIHGNPGDYRQAYLGNTLTTVTDYTLNCGSLSDYVWSEVPQDVSTLWNQDGAIVITNPKEATVENWNLQYWLVNNISLTTGQTYQMTINCKAEGDVAANVSFKLGDWNDGSIGNFIIPVGGDYIDITVDVIPTMASSGLMLQHGHHVGKIYWKSIKITHKAASGNRVAYPTFTTEWQNYHVSGSFANFDGAGKSIAFNLSNYAPANKYYFKNISFKINGVEQVVNGDLSTDDVSAYYQKINQGTIVPSTITKKMETVTVGTPGVEDLNTEHDARYANATTVDVGNQWNGRAYTYVLQPGDLTYTLTTSQGGSHQHTATRPASNGKTNDIFAAWYKLDFNIKSAR